MNFLSDKYAFGYADWLSCKPELQNTQILKLGSEIPKNTNTTSQTLIIASPGARLFESLRHSNKNQSHESWQKSW